MGHTGSKLKYFGATDVGQVRDHNEDSFVIIDLSREETHPMGTIFMVADGMGGANAGEVASAIACNVIEDRLLKLQKLPDSDRDIEKYLKNLVLEAHQQIISHASEHPECVGMGTTAVVGWVIADHLHLVWCGDSRCYVYQKSQQHTLAPLSDDHSLVWQMVLNGELSAEEARLHDQSNIILQVLGSTDTKPKPTYLNKRLVEGEKILLCSDGLNGMLSDASVQQILETQEDVKTTTEVLIEAAKQAGGTDNITVIYVEVEATSNKAFVQKGNVSSALRSKWPFIMVITLILLVLLFSLIAWKDNGTLSDDAKVAVNVPSPPAQENAHKHDEAFKENVTIQEPVASNTEADNAAVATAKEEVNDDAYNFHAALAQLDEKLEQQIVSTKKLIEGCKSCNDNPQLESVNESLTATHDWIKNQIKRANLHLPITSQSKEQLFSISQTVNVSYDANQSFDAESALSEQEYLISTINEVILKISEDLERLISNVREKN